MNPLNVSEGWPEQPDRIVTREAPEIAAAMARVGHDGREHHIVIIRRDREAGGWVGVPAVFVRCDICGVDIVGKPLQILDVSVVEWRAQLASSIVEHAWPRIDWHAEPGDPVPASFRGESRGFMHPVERRVPYPHDATPEERRQLIAAMRLRSFLTERGLVVDTTSGTPTVSVRRKT